MNVLTFLGIDLREIIYQSCYSSCFIKKLNKKLCSCFTITDKALFACYRFFLSASFFEFIRKGDTET